jgi:integrative and conjugative element protein (TIGR02256 family)
MLKTAGYVMSNEWEMDVPNYGLVRVSGELIIKLTEYCQLNKEAPESGGVLIGKHLNSGGMILVDNFTPPQSKDKQGRCLYHRSIEHNKFVRRIWKDSNGHLTYLGLWHTHPEPKPNYSGTDKKDWLNALSKSRYEGERLYFFIVGQTHIRCWLGTKILYRNKIELLGEYEIGK